MSGGAAALVGDSFDRIHDGITAVLDGLDRDDLRREPLPGANPVGWLVWHLLRVQDDHLADAAGREQVWTRDDWHGRFALPFPAEATGYGQSAQEVGQVDVDPALLLGYAASVHEATASIVDGLDEDDLDRVVDDSWDPPVTMGVRLVSVLGDDLKHLGQAEYVKGLLHAE